MSEEQGALDLGLGVVESVWALSLWQPWASLWASGEKMNETRGPRGRTTRRGRVLVHAAKRFDADVRAYCDMDPFKSCLAKHVDTLSEIPLGALVGEVNLVDCVRVETIRDSLSEQEEEFGDYSDGRFALVADSWKLYDKPIPYRGMQGFFKVEI